MSTQNHINILVMPTDECNMNCLYCFHKPFQKDTNKMNISTVEHLLNITTPFYKHINLIWHGGEPLLMGLSFYKQVLELEKNYPTTFSNSVQSNLTLLTDEMADFFSINNFNLSGSYDGISNIISRGHDSEILSGRQLMIDRGKRSGLIMVVSNLNINNLIDNYKIFKQLQVNISLNLYLDQKNCQRKELQLNEAVTITKLKELFDYWAYDISGNIHISYFKHILDYIFFKKKSLCTYTSCIGRWLGIRHNGDIVPCNRFFPQVYSYGNIYEYDNINEAFDSSGFGLLLKQAISRREKCKHCHIYDFCCGGCNNNALNENGIENNGGLGCKILISLYEYIDSFLQNKLFSNTKLNPMLMLMIKKAQIF